MFSFKFCVKFYSSCSRLPIFHLFLFISYKFWSILKWRWETSLVSEQVGCVFRTILSSMINFWLYLNSTIYWWSTFKSFEKSLLNWVFSFYDSEMYKFCSFLNANLLPNSLSVLLENILNLLLIMASISYEIYWSTLCLTCFWRV